MDGERGTGYTEEENLRSHWALHRRLQATSQLRQGDLAGRGNQEGQVELQPGQVELEPGQVKLDLGQVELEPGQVAQEGWESMQHSQKKGVE